MAQLDQKPGSGRALWTDGWDAFPAARHRLLSLLRDRRVANPVVLSGDIHSFWAADLRVDADDLGTPAVASEFVCSSITSQGVPHEQFAAFLPENPHIRFMDARWRGYAACTVERDRWTTTFRALDTVLDRNSSIRNLAAFVTEHGRPGVSAA
jgi:alkaline phosphatase D